MRRLAAPAFVATWLDAAGAAGMPSLEVLQGVPLVSDALARLPKTKALDTTSLRSIYEAGWENLRQEQDRERQRRGAAGSAAAPERDMRVGDKSTPKWQRLLHRPLLTLASNEALELVNASPNALHHFRRIESKENKFARRWLSIVPRSMHLIIPDLYYRAYASWYFGYGCMPFFQGRLRTNEQRVRDKVKLADYKCQNRFLSSGEQCGEYFDGYSEHLMTCSHAKQTLAHHPVKHALADAIQRELKIPTRTEQIVWELTQTVARGKRCKIHKDSVLDIVLHSRPEVAIDVSESRRWFTMEKCNKELQAPRQIILVPASTFPSA